MQSQISDFSQEMQEYVAGLPEQRYGKRIDLQLFMPVPIQHHKE